MEIKEAEVTPYLSEIMSHSRQEANSNGIPFVEVLIDRVRQDVVAMGNDPCTDKKFVLRRNCGIEQFRRAVVDCVQVPPPYERKPSLYPFVFSALMTAHVFESREEAEQANVELVEKYNTTSFRVDCEVVTLKQAIDDALGHLEKLQENF